MNEKQKNVLIVVGVVILGMLLYAPYHYKGAEGVVVGAGYKWIFSDTDRAMIDVGVLLTQWIGVLIIGAIAYFMYKDR
jgi:hypothetical protein